MNMNRNNDGQFNISNDNRDNRNPDNGLRQKFLRKVPNKGAFVFPEILSSRLSS